MRLADYSQPVTVDQLDAALRQGSFEGVFHYLSGTPGYVLRVEDPTVVAGIRARGWQQAGIDLPYASSSADGAAFASVARSYGFPPSSRMYLDIEPDRFAVAPASWPAAANRWCDAVRAAGLSPGIYGTDATVAACSDHADTIWRAVPGQCDPAGPGLAPTFFAGRRAIQCQSGMWGGVSFDVSFSQFTLGGQDMLDPNDPVVVDLRGRLGALQYVIGPAPGQDGPAGEVVAALRALTGAPASLAALKTELDQVQVAITAQSGGVLPAPADLSKVYAELATLGKHLGVDVVTGAAT